MAVDKLRSLEDVRAAHDMVKALVNGRVDVGLGFVERMALSGLMPLLCWVLGHDNGDSVEEHFASLRERLKAGGFTPGRYPDPGSDNPQLN